ncbi:MAG: putative bifunctional diguanylate cyclase/phosphodiesterase [Acidimicrobiales bacterium]
MAAPRSPGSAIQLAPPLGAIASRRSLSHAEALTLLEEAEDTLRAIGVGEIDAFVVSDGTSTQRVFTLSTADRPYRHFVENMRDGAATLSPDGVILYGNRRLAELLACTRAELLGARLSAFMYGHDDLDWTTTRGSGPGGTTVELDLIDVRGATVPVLVGISPLVEEDDDLVCLTFTDLSAQRAQEQEISRLGAAQEARLADLQQAQAALTKQATHDALTGLPNRDLLVDRIDQALRQAARARQCTALFFIDLDRFKNVNDTRGHAVGNRVLRGVAERLAAVTRDMDTVARIGGDEFVVLAPNIGNHLHAVDAGTRIVHELMRRCADPTESVNASVGIALSEDGRGSAEVLLHEADTAMYQAKEAGGARCALFDDRLAEEVRGRKAAQSALQAALDEGRVAPYYQPIIDLATGRISGFEALARLVERDGTVLPPAFFIPVAEESGLVLPLGAQILERACQQATLWPGHDSIDLAVAVNVSSRQLEPGDLTAVVCNTLARTGLLPSRLHLELTETAIMDLHPEILRQLSRIRELGVQIGLDDFGTGYASLTHLRRLPLDFVKVDRSFVQGLGHDAGDERIVSAVVDLARNLGLRSVGEGVETEEQLHRLRELGCDEGQGYLFARPAPPEELLFTVSDLP